MNHPQVPQGCTEATSSGGKEELHGPTLPKPRSSVSLSPWGPLFGGQGEELSPRANGMEKHGDNEPRLGRDSLGGWAEEPHEMPARPPHWWPLLKWWR